MKTRFQLCPSASLLPMSDNKNVNWTGWLGPKRNGWVGYFQPPTMWPNKLTKAWRIKVGTGYASPIVSGGLVYQHGRQGNNEVVWCLDLRTGAVKWRKSYPAPFEIGGGGEYHGKGPFGCPILAGGRLFTMSVTGTLIAWDASSGKRLWSRNFGKRFKEPHPRWGASTSPIVDGKQVIAHFGTDFNGALIALDTPTGKELWSQGKDGPQYSSPLVVEIQGVRQVIDWNERAIVGVDIQSGKKLWEVAAKGTFLDQNMPTPVFYNGRILLGAENRGIRCLVPRKVSGTWKVDEPWHQRKVALNMSTAVINKGVLYGLSHYDRGRFFCLDPKTGNVLWQGPFQTGKHVTLLAIPGHVAALINTGELRIFAANRKGYKKVASYRVAPGRTWAPPVLLKDGILIKDLETLTLWTIPDSKE
ncbi:MAG: PQQ-binding-like beta-propeller repeat protein [Gemmataceae bacterium]